MIEKIKHLKIFILILSSLILTGFSVNQLNGFWSVTSSSGVSALSMTNTDNAVDINDLTTYTFSSKSFGAVPGVGEKRWILVTAGCVDNDGSFSVTSALIAGNSATILQAFSSSSGNNVSILTYIILDVPTGTSGNIVITLSDQPFGCGISVYRIISADSADLTSTHATASDITDSSGVMTASINCPAGGVILGGRQGRNDSSNTWTGGLSEDYDVDTNTNEWFTTGSGVFSTLQTGLSTTVTNADTTPGGPELFAMISFGPNGAT